MRYHREPWHVTATHTWTRATEPDSTRTCSEPPRGAAHAAPPGGHRGDVGGGGRGPRGRGAVLHGPAVAGRQPVSRDQPALRWSWGCWRSGGSAARACSSTPRTWGTRGRRAGSRCRSPPAPPSCAGRRTPGPRWRAASSTRACGWTCSPRLARAVRLSADGPGAEEGRMRSRAGGGWGSAASPRRWCRGGARARQVVLGVQLRRPAADGGAAATPAVLRAGGAQHGRHRRDGAAGPAAGGRGVVPRRERPGSRTAAATRCW